jgi:predicted metal-dependent hydrolase
MEHIAIKDLAVEVRRSARRKTVELSVGRNGEVVLHAPKTTTTEKLAELLHGKLVWIYQQLGRKQEELHQQPAKEYVSGEGFYYRGRTYRLKLTDDFLTVRNGKHLQLLSGRFRMHRILAATGREVFIKWYTDRAEDWIPRRVCQLQDRVGIVPESLEIRDLGFRWGSCTGKGKLLFHWRIILLPPERIDYLIQHELVHLHEHNHGLAFYERLQRAVPDYELQEQWLRVHGDRYGL